MRASARPAARSASPRSTGPRSLVVSGAERRGRGGRRQLAGARTSQAAAGQPRLPLAADGADARRLPRGVARTLTYQPPRIAAVSNSDRRARRPRSLLDRTTGCGTSAQPSASPTPCGPGRGRRRPPSSSSARTARLAPMIADCLQRPARTEPSAAALRRDRDEAEALPARWRFVHARGGARPGPRVLGAAGAVELPTYSVRPPAATGSTAGGPRPAAGPSARS